MTAAKPIALLIGGCSPGEACLLVLELDLAECFPSTTVISSNHNHPQTTHSIESRPLSGNHHITTPSTPHLLVSQPTTIMYRQSLVNAVRPALRFPSRAAFTTTSRTMAEGDTGGIRSSGYAPFRTCPSLLMPTSTRQ